MVKVLGVSVCMMAVCLQAGAAPAEPLPDVGALTAYLESDRYGAPVIELGGDSPLIISFDLLEPERRYLRYSLTHCDASWQPDMLQPIEFANGFNEAAIDDYAYSQGTLSPYVNYRISLPNPDITPTVSGNYMLTVFDEEQPESPLFSIPFMVAENSVRMAPSVSSRTDYDYNGSHQQLEVSADLSALDTPDPWNDLLLVITPDFMRDRSQTVTRPMRVNGTTATFAHDPGLTFEAGNEFRRFETVSTSRYLPMGVEMVAFQDPFYHFKLYTDSPRASTDYRYDQTQFGRFTINADDANDPDTQGEYVKVHFALDLPEQPYADVIIAGELTGNTTAPTETGVMTFNRISNLYEAVLTLKQGSYNYMYYLIPHNGKATAAPIEGNDYRTANRYDIALYYRKPGSRFDRLIGFTTIISGI